MLDAVTDGRSVAMGVEGSVPIAAAHAKSASAGTFDFAANAVRTPQSARERERSTARPPKGSYPNENAESGVSLASSVGNLVQAAGHKIDLSVYAREFVGHLFEGKVGDGAEVAAVEALGSLGEGDVGLDADGTLGGRRRRMLR